MLVFICLSLVAVALGAPSSCIRNCQSTNSPVCGSDGRTYMNSCDLHNANCRNIELGLTHIRYSHSGACGNIRRAHNTASCDQICDEERSPICASDGVVYDNNCRFNQAQCHAIKNGTRLSIVSYGSTCPTPVEADCEKYAVNTSDIAIEGPLGGTIQTLCPHSQMPVCTNHGTFIGECQLCQHINSYIDKIKYNPTLPVPDFKILYSGTCHTALHPGFIR
ncbi:ovoinhibitor-like [Haliotis asinina]|uniref:ovoinhibitor-like n=1 Tax=Haliotis asinina TaxID=109174 RepID=UPI0035323306